jgi:hypothetical protein
VLLFAIDIAYARVLCIVIDIILSGTIHTILAMRTFRGQIVTVNVSFSLI